MPFVGFRILCSIDILLEFVFYKKMLMLSVTIHTIIPETPDTLTIVFDPEGVPFHYQAGQYITLLTYIDGVAYYRPYSLGSSPYTDTYPSITVKRVKGGRVSNYLNDQITPGQRVEILPPQGYFTLVPLPEGKRDLVFIAGGSGITPLYGMIKTALSQEPKSRLYLIYANRHSEDIIYHKELEKLTTASKGRLEITYVLSQPPAAWQGVSGRLDQTTLAGLLKERKLGGEAHYFLCAPKGLIDMSVTTLSGMEVRMKQMHTESFTAPETQAYPESVKARVTILSDGEEEEVEVAKGDRILESAYEQGIYTIPSSCRNGICDTCRAKCIEGKVHMQTDEGLTEEEKAEGYILTCMSQPLTEKVVVEID